MVACAPRLHHTASAGLRRADLLHLPVRADGPRAADGARPQHPRPNRARRARDPPGDLQRCLHPASGNCVQHGSRAALSCDALLDSRNRRGDDRLRRRSAARAARGGPRGERRRRSARRARHRRRQGGRPAAAAAHLRPRRHVPPAPSPVRILRAVRRPHRSGQGLRGADRVFQLVRTRRRRCVADPDGGEADAASGGALDPLRRFALGTRAPASARSGDDRRRALALREPLTARTRSLCRRYASARQRAQRGPGRSLPAQQRRALLRRS